MSFDPPEVGKTDLASDLEYRLEISSILMAHSLTSPERRERAVMDYVETHSDTASHESVSRAASRLLRDYVPCDGIGY